MEILNKTILIEVPCKNKITNNICIYQVEAYNFIEAKRILEFILGLGYIVGYGSM